MVGEIADAPTCLAILEQYGDQTTEPRAKGLVAVLAAQDPDDPTRTLEQLALIDVAHGYDRQSDAMARLWSAHYLENDGDPERALDEASRGLALVEDADGPWIRAMMHSVAGGLNAQLGKREEAAHHARQAIPILDLLEANDDGIQARSLLAGHAISEGRFDEAERLIAEIDAAHPRAHGLRWCLRHRHGPCRARAGPGRGRGGPAALPRRRPGAGRASRFPGMELTGFEPWTLFGDAAGTTAYALHGSDQEGADLFEALRAKAPQVLNPDRPRMDYPVAGMVLHGLGTWGLLKQAMDPEDAIRLLVLAELFAYPQFTTHHGPRPHRTRGRAGRAGSDRPAPRGVRRAQGPGPPAGGPGRRRADR